MADKYKRNGSIDILLQIGWIKPKGRRNTPGRPTTWGTTDSFLVQFGLDDIKNLPYKQELKASGFLEKKSALGFAILFLLASSLGKKNLFNQKLEDFVLE